MTIHSGHPFADPDPDQARRLRGRLGGAVSLWTSGLGSERAGLTVSSLMVATGEPASVLALVDPDGDLAEALTRTRRAVVHLLAWRHRQLAEVFAGEAPAPGGMFTQASFVDTPWGPRLADADTWAGVVLSDARDVGWSLVVTCAVEHLEIGPDDDPLQHRRGRFERSSG
ncbi:Flavin reductase domain protein, FMN-binding protein [metagenome]|uniref:Flavin reductase domain protein, FMN-binding protein n=1 Tax=metagenome TaxID=256318 RepID=A0A2P2BW59_9ZZZZ